MYIILCIITFFFLAKSESPTLNALRKTLALYNVGVGEPNYMLPLVPGRDIFRPHIICTSYNMFTSVLSGVISSTVSPKVDSRIFACMVNKMIEVPVYVYRTLPIRTQKIIGLHL